jgi:hypothetical protein
MLGSHQQCLTYARRIGSVQITTIRTMSMSQLYKMFIKTVLHYAQTDANIPDIT